MRARTHTHTHPSGVNARSPHESTSPHPTPPINYVSIFTTARNTPLLGRNAERNELVQRVFKLFTGTPTAFDKRTAIHYARLSRRNRRKQTRARAPFISADRFERERERERASLENLINSVRENGGVLREYNGITLGKNSAGK